MDIQTALQKELDEFVSQPFPDMAVNKHFTLIPDLIKKYSPYNLKVSINDFTNVATLDPDTVTYKQAGSCLNLLITQTMASLNMSLDEYVQFYRDVEEAIKVLNEHVSSEQARLKNKGEALTNAEKKSGRKIEMPQA